MCGLTSTTLAANTPAVGTGAWSIVSGAGGSLATRAARHRPSAEALGRVTRCVGRSAMRPAPPRLTMWRSPFNGIRPWQTRGLTRLVPAMCGLTSTTLAANTPAVGTGAWSIVSGAGGSFGNASSRHRPSAEALDELHVAWTISNAPCTASTDDVVITFQRNPTVANAGPDQTGAAMCGLTSTTLAGEHAGSGNGGWSIVSGAGAPLATRAARHRPSAEPLDELHVALDDQQCALHRLD